MITIGILFVYVVGHIFELKTLNMICAALPLIFGALFIWMPETPYFYVIKYRPEDAVKSLKRLRGEQYNYHDELNEMCIEHERMIQRQRSLLSILRQTAAKRALMITLVLVLLTQLSGINAVIFYTAFIFQASETGIEPSLATIFVGIMQVIGTFGASLTVDRLGRRFLLISSAIIMCICNIGLGIYFYLLKQNSPYAQQLNWLPLGSLCIYIIAFSIGLGFVYIQLLGIKF